MVREIGLADSRLSRISRALRWIREHYAEPFRIEDLARQVATSPTSFHRHFRAATATRPLQYQKRTRLQEARSRLITKANDVANVGFSMGYESPSQFSSPALGTQKAPLNQELTVDTSLMSPSCCPRESRTFTAFALISGLKCE